MTVESAPVTCLNVGGLAAYLGVSRGTVNRMLADGRLPHHRLRGRVIFTPDDVRALLSQTEWQPLKKP